MKKLFSKRILQLHPSPTMAIDNLAKEMKQQGRSIINLSAGEPDFDTPSHIQKAAIEAIKKSFTKYTNPQGIIPLRESITQKFLTENGISYSPSEVMIGVGSKQLLYVALQTLCEKGDEVIIPTPTWSTFVEQTKLAGGKPVLLSLTSPFKLMAKDIERILTKKTKLVILNSPSNPTGAIIDRKELEKIADLAIKHNFWIITDEIYEKLIYKGPHVSIASINEAIKKRTVTINGVSKSYAMTGWRVGYAGGPQEVISAMTRLQSQMISSVNSISQMATLAAFEEESNEITKMHSSFATRRTYLIKELSTIKTISFAEPEGAFYFFISIEKLLNKTYPTSANWCEGLLEKEGVALVPGEAFFAPGFVRLSFAARMNDLEEAVKRINEFIQIDNKKTY